jgi:hypothetical protein
MTVKGSVHGSLKYYDSERGLLNHIFHMYSATLMKVSEITR